MNISEAWGYYEKDKRFLKYSEYTLKAYKIQMNVFIRYLGDRDIKEYRYLDLKDYLNEVCSTMKPSSITHKVRFIRSFFRWAHEEGFIETNVASKLKEPKLSRGKPKPLSEFEIEGLREACSTPSERLIFEFLYSTGCRIGEAIKINISDINWNERSIVVNGKGNKDRAVYFNTICEIWIKKHLATRSDDEEALFTTQRRPIRRVSIAQMRNILKRIARRAGLNESIHPHQLRHSFAMRLLENGAPMEGIQTLLGHEDMKYTRVYADLTSEMRRDIYKKFF